MSFNEIRPVNDDEIAQFKQDGVVRLRGALSKDVVDKLASSIERLAAAVKHSPSGYDLENLGDVAYSDAEHIDYGHAKQYDLELLAGWLRYEGNPRAIEEVSEDAPKGSFLLDTGCWRRDENLAELATSWMIGKIASQLLSSKTIAFYDDQMFIKRPGTRQKTSWHQDLPFFHIDGNQGLVMWIPVDPVTEENGGMKYVRGSHKWRDEFGASLFISRTLMPGAPGNMVPDIDAEPDRYDILSFDADPGDILVHHFKTIHCANGNKSAWRNRRAMSLRYVGDDVRYRLRGGAPFPPHLTCEFVEGERICCDDYPLIYDDARRGERANTDTVGANA